MVSKTAIWVTVYRSAITGRFVLAAYAKKHPDTTIMQAVTKEPKA